MTYLIEAPDDDDTGALPGCPGMPQGRPVTKILVVDDSAGYRHLISRALSHLGFEILEAGDGREALAVLSANPGIGLVVSDWEMPELDGPGLCRAVRSQDFGRYIYLILVTARTGAEDLLAGMDAGADDFLTKPVNLAELRARVRAGQRVVDLEAALAERNRSLAEAYRRIEADLNAAAELQVSMLPPQRITISPFVCERLFLPSTFVSGDMLNVFEPDQDHIAFFIMDVAGHGVRAAMSSVMVSRHLLRGNAAVPAESRSGEARPAGWPASATQVVAELNRQFQSGGDSVSYFTMVYGVIDKHTGRTEMTQAGHTHPIQIGADGSGRILGDGGFPVGLLLDATYEASEFIMERGDRLYLYSDGVTECANGEGELFGQERLIERLKACAGKPLGDVVRDLEAGLRAWRGAGQHAFSDDISVLVIERQ